MNTPSPEQKCKSTKLGGGERKKYNLRRYIMLKITKSDFVTKPIEAISSCVEGCKLGNS